MAHLILGVLLLFAPCWKLGFSRIFLLYWILYDCLEIYTPFIYGKGFNAYITMAFIIHYTWFSTNNWIVDHFTIVAGFLFCTWLWPLYAMGDLEPLASGSPGVDVPSLLFMVIGAICMHGLFSVMGYLFVDAEDPRASQE